MKKMVQQFRNYNANDALEHHPLTIKANGAL